MHAAELASIATLIRSQRQAALGTLRDGAPFVSMVAYAIEPGFTGFLLYLSQLAAHTQQLLTAPQASLLISASDDGRDDVQTLERMTLLGTAAPLLTTSDEYTAAKSCYLARLPAAAMLFDFPDFILFRFVPSSARFIGGFARAYTLTAEQLRSAAEY